mgnify:CR=1 FL=1
MFITHSFTLQNLRTIVLQLSISWWISGENPWTSPENSLLQRSELCPFQSESHFVVPDPQYKALSQSCTVCIHVPTFLRGHGCYRYYGFWAKSYIFSFIGSLDNGTQQEPITRSVCLPFGYLNHQRSRWVFLEHRWTKGRRVQWIKYKTIVIRKGMVDFWSQIWNAKQITNRQARDNVG